MVGKLLGSHAVHLGNGAHGLVKFEVADLHLHVLGQLLQREVAAHANFGIFGKVGHKVVQLALLFHERFVLAPLHALTLEVVLDFFHHPVAAAIQQRLGNVHGHAVYEVSDQFFAAGLFAFLLGAALQLALEVGTQALHRLKVQALCKLVIQVLQLLGLYFQDLDLHGVGGMLVVAVLVGWNGNFYAVALVLAQQSVTHMLLGYVEVNGVRAALFTVFFDGDLVARFNGAVGALEGGVALLQVGQGAAQYFVSNFGAVRGNFGFFPVAQLDFGVGFARHRELEGLAADHRLGVNLGVHEVQFQFACALGVVRLQQAIHHLAFDIALTHAALNHLAGRFARTEARYTHVAGQTRPDLFVHAVNFIRRNRNLKFDLVAFFAD